MAFDVYQWHSLSFSTTDEHKWNSNIQFTFSNGIKRQAINNILCMHNLKRRIEKRRRRRRIAVKGAFEHICVTLNDILWLKGNGNLRMCERMN